MTEFNKERVLVAYSELNALREAEIHDLPDFLERVEARGSRGFHSGLDPALWWLETEVKRHGFFFWHHFEGDDAFGGTKSVYTLEEIRPTGHFDTGSAEDRFNAIQRMPRKAITADVINEQVEIVHEAKRNGFDVAWDSSTQCFVFVPMLDALYS